MKHFIVSCSALLFLLIISSGCTSKNDYDIKKHFDQEEISTILTNIIIYIYKVPRGVNKADKQNPEYRNLYENQIEAFTMVYYHVDDKDSTHYFYIIRPARNEFGHKRGVAGKYKLHEDLSLLEFEEIFNTPMLPVDTILARGSHLWEDLMYYKNVDRYFMNLNYIEFPNENCTYDKLLKEWVY